MPINTPNTSSINDILKGLDTQHLDLFATILSKGERALKPYKGTTAIPLVDHLYSSTDTTPIAIAFHQFLQDNEIVYLGGGNSKNFQVKPRDKSTPYVLKLEGWAMPANVEVQLQGNALLAPVYGQYAATHRGRDVRIQVTPLYVGDIETLACKPMSDETRTSESLRVYQQMASAYEGYRQANIVFPDGKNSNWLMDDQQDLRMTDTKSLLEAQNGRLDTGLEQYKDYFMSIPERPPYDVDNVHSLHLGKNIYQYLTQCSFLYLSDPSSPNVYVASNSARGCDARNYDFTAPIFQTPAGIRLHRLIENMIKVKPIERLSVADALLELAELQSQLSAGVVKRECTVGIRNNEDRTVLIRECNLLIKELRKLNINNDPSMSQLITDQRNKVANETDPSNLRKIKDELSVQISAETKARLEFEKQEKICNDLVAKIALYKLSLKDCTMDDFVHDKRQAILRATNINGLSNIAIELRNTLSILETSKPVVDRVKDMFIAYQMDTTFYKRGKAEKGNQIERAMIQVPIEQRGDILTADTVSAVSVRAALATRRGFMTNTVPLGNDGKIDDTKAASRFVKFKAEFTASKAKGMAADTQKDDDATVNSIQSQVRKS